MIIPTDSFAGLINFFLVESPGLRPGINSAAIAGVPSAAAALGWLRWLVEWFIQ